MIIIICINLETLTTRHASSMMFCINVTDQLKSEILRNLQISLQCLGNMTNRLQTLF